jgi:hypothetical protein
MRFGEPGRHRQQLFAERTIQKIQAPLLERMTAQEMLTGLTSVEWSEDFHDIVKRVDDLWQKNPSDIPTGPLKVTKKLDLLSEEIRIRVKLTDPISVFRQKLHRSFWTGNIRWNPKICVIKKMILLPEQFPTYLLDGLQGRLGVSKCAYTRKELQVVLDDKKPHRILYLEDNLKRFFDSIPEMVRGNI